jgi:hypothetical protein
MVKKHKPNSDKTDEIKPGMVVEATKGDLGEEDVTKPKVTAGASARRKPRRFNYLKVI